MTEQTLKQKLIWFDNRMTYIIGFRNLYNFTVMAIGVMCLYFGEQLGTPYYFMLALIMFVFAGKWFLTQVRENIDTMDVTDALTSKE